MSKNAARLGDVDSHGIPLTTCSPNVFINDIGSCRVGDVHGDHGAITQGAPHVYINGRQAGRIGDPVACGGTVASGSPNTFIGDLSGADLVDKVSSSAIKSALTSARYQINKDYVLNNAKASDEDKTIVSLADIALNMAQNHIEDPANKQGWEYLSEIFIKMLSGKAYDSAEQDLNLPTAPTPFYIDWDWFISFDIAKEKFDGFANDLRTKGTIFSPKALKSLENILKRDFSEQWNNKENFAFDYSVVPWYDLEKSYYTQTNISQQEAFNLTDIMGEVNGLYAALASCSIRALAKGSVIFIDENPIIQVEDVHVFVRDSLNFAESSSPLDIIKDSLWQWDKDALEFYKIPFLTDGVFLTNASINSFRNTYNIGSDFLVLSKPLSLGYAIRFNGDD